MSAGIDIRQAERDSEAERARKKRARQEATRKDRARRWALPKHEQLRRFGTEDGDLETDGHRLLAEENMDVGAGKAEGERTRVLTHAEGMHRLGKITWEEWQAAEELRIRVLALLPRSEGVSSYGLSPGRSDPATKAARKGLALTGLNVNWQTGDVERDKQHNRSARQEAADLIYAMAEGIEPETGGKVFNHKLAEFIIRSVLGNEIDLTEIGHALTHYKGEKQASAAGGAILKAAFHRGAVCLGLAKADDWDWRLRWMSA
jgi:hypothetical protein